MDGYAWSNYWTDVPENITNSGTAFFFDWIDDIKFRFYIPYTMEAIYVKQHVNGTWTSWRIITTPSS